MSSATDNGTNTLKALGLGLLLAILFYAGLGVYAFLNKDETLDMLSQKLAVNVSLIEKGEFPVIVDGPLTNEDIEISNKDHTSKEAEQVHAPSEPPSEAPSEGPSEVSQPETVADIPPANEPDMNATLTQSLKGDPNLRARTNALPEAPIDGNFERTADGLLPIISPDGLKPFDAYKKPHLLNTSAHAIAVAVSDYGLSEKLSRQALDLLPSGISLILSPYSTDPEKWMKAARADGHEVWLELPMQTAEFPYKDPGAQGLMVDVSLSYNQDRLHWLMGRAQGYAGVAGYSDKTLEKSAPMFEKIINSIISRGLGYYELNPIGGDFIAGHVAAKHAPYLHTNGTVQSLSSAHALSNINTLVKSQNYSTLVLTPSPKGIKDMAAWLETLQDKRVSIVPLSALAALKKGKVAQDISEPTDLEAHKGNEAHAPTVEAQH
ncbi:MAG: divergent polysaccharide deacetylase family protein [Micavibrio sp.]|nr:divergent polysaccharide deacetylase family protein [Micavibrio sp.]